jgi:hypothetical protein
MSDEIMKVPETTLDGFDSDTDESQSRRVIQGSRLAFTNDFEWVDSNDEPVPRDRELIMVDRVRVLQKWIDQKPVETRFLEPNEKWPDVEAMNKAAPQSEWREGPDGKPQGPHSCQWVIYLIDPLTLDKFTYPTNTVGGHICIGDISDRIKNMRRFRGEHVYPVVTLSDAFMNTRFGGRQRPHFEVKRWVKLGGGGGAAEALPPPPPTTTPPQQAAADLPLHEVKELSFAEEIGDEIPDFENEETAPAKGATKVPKGAVLESVTTSASGILRMFRGHNIDLRASGHCVVSKDGKELHRADNESAARAWITDRLKKKPPRKPNILAAG